MADRMPMAAPAVSGEAVRATASILARQAGVHGLNLLGAVLLARLLSPAQFGLYTIVLFAGMAMNMLASPGLASDLLRRPQVPVAGVESFFGIKTAAALCAAAAVWWASPWLVRLYSLGPRYALIFYGIALGTALVPLQFVPRLHLEHALRFEKVAVVEVCQALAFNGVAVVLTVAGHPLAALSTALPARSAVGALAYAIAHRWRTLPRISWAGVRPHLRFGLEIQGANLVSMAKDSLNPVIIGTYLGVAAAGQVRWALLVAGAGGVAVAALQRAYLPLFARLSGDAGRLGRAVETSIWLANSIIAPVSVIIFVAIAPITVIIFGPKWLAALPLFYLVWCGNVVSGTGFTLTALLNSVGRSAVTLRLAAIYAAALWAVTVPLLLLLHTPMAFAIGSAAEYALLLLTIPASRAVVHIRLIPSLAGPWALAGLAGVAVVGAQRLFPPVSAGRLTLDLGVGIATYSAAATVCYARRLRSLPALWARGPRDQVVGGV